MPLPCSIDQLLPIAWSKGQVIEVEHFCHNDRRSAALAHVHSLIRPGGFGIVCHDIPPGREEQLLGISPTDSGRMAHIAVTIKHDFVAMGANGELLVIPSSARTGRPNIEAEVPLAFGSKRPTVDEYYIMIGKARWKDSSPTSLLLDLGPQRPFKLLCDAPRLVIQDTQSVLSSPASYTDLLPIALLRFTGRDLELDESWVPPVTSIDVGLSISSAVWRELVLELGALLAALDYRSPHMVGLPLGERIAAWRELARRLAPAAPIVCDPVGVSTHDLLSALWHPVQAWIRAFHDQLCLKAAFDEAAVARFARVGCTTDLMACLTRSLIGLREAQRTQ